MNMPNSSSWMILLRTRILNRSFMSRDSYGVECTQQTVSSWMSFIIEGSSVVWMGNVLHGLTGLNTWSSAAGRALKMSSVGRSWSLEPALRFLSLVPLLSSFLHNCRCHVTSHLMILPPCLPSTLSPSIHFLPFQTFLSSKQVGAARKAKGWIEGPSNSLFKCTNPERQDEGEVIKLWIVLWGTDFSPCFGIPPE